MIYFKELGEVLKKNAKIILINTGIIWYLIPFIFTVLYAIYILFTGLTSEGIVELIIKASYALIPRLADVILTPIKEIISILVVFIVVLNTYWVAHKVNN